MTTPDSNLAAFLVFKGLTFEYLVEDTNGRQRVFFSFPSLSAEQAGVLTLEFLNGEFQHFCDAQRLIKNVIRNIVR